MRRIAATSIVLLASAGCTILSGVGDLEVGGAPDASALPEASVKADATVVVPPGDAGDAGNGPDSSSPVANDAAADAPADVSSPPVDAAPDVIVPTKNFCETVPGSVELCFDYDSSSYEATETIVKSATMTVEAPGFDSDKSLRCVGDDGVAPQAFHARQLPANITKLRLSFLVQVDEPGLGVEFDEVEFTYGTGKCALQPTLSNGNLMINEFCPDQGAPDQVNHIITPVASGAPWYTFDIYLDFRTRSFSGTITKPGGDVTFGPIALDKRFVTSSVAHLNAGLVFGPKHTPGAKLRTDNITVDIQ